MEKRLKNLLEELGITGNETRVYLAGLELGPTTITKIAARAHVERATVYATLERLRAKGLVGKEVKPYSRMVQVESPDKLLILARQKRREIKRQELDLQEILPDLLAQVHQKGKQPKVRFYDGREQFIQVFDQALDEAKDKMYYFGAVDMFVKAVSWEFEKEWIKRRCRKCIFIYLLVNKSVLAKRYKEHDAHELRETRLYSGNMDFESSFLLWGNKVLLWNPVVPLVIAIEDEIITRMLKEMFLKLWEV